MFSLPTIALLFSLLLLLLLLQIILSSKRNKAPSLSYPPSPPSFPIIGHLHLLKPLLHQAFKDLSQKYGPLILLKIGSARFVVANNPSLTKEFLKLNELAYSSRNMNMAIDMVTYHDSSFAFAQCNNYWKFIKKLSISELLGSRSLLRFLPVRTREIHEFVQSLAEKSMANESVNLTEMLMKLSNNIISQMMLSIKSSGTDDQAEEARVLAREVTKIFGEFNISDFIGFLKVLDLQGFKKRAMQIHKRYDALLEKIISDRETLRYKMNTMNKSSSCEEDVKSFLDILLDVSKDKDSEIELTRNHIKALILDYFTAATDTTAVSVQWAIAELFNNPRVLKKAQEEMDRVTGNQRLVCEEDSPNLPYIHAIIKETLRLHPPIPLLIRKGLTDCIVGGYKIPKGSMACINIWAMGRDPTLWESPTEFRPERFLEGEGNTLDIKGNHFELLPFGSGKRGCLGMNLALRELLAIIGALLQCFDWKMFDSEGKLLSYGIPIDMDEQPGLTVPRAHDLICVPVARLNPIPLLQPRA
ncbi:hypothetical protein PIB30_042649 [Stylosanthes scabra]|uniref:Cytochrome P450 n=1 Tax=Stylosanthes scabra TaxID=79078 RepID=A0ABU6RFN8_9FABA|nr:hypothetical protein [Stylosanthes scabra]